MYSARLRFVSKSVLYKSTVVVMLWNKFVEQTSLNAGKEEVRSGEC